MTKPEIEQIKKVIRGLREIRRRPPKEFRKKEIEAISYALDYLAEDLSKINSKK